MTSHFVSRLAPRIRQYLDLKQALGRHYVVEQGTLVSLDRFLSEKNNRYHDLTPQAFNAWCQRQLHVTSGIRRNRMRIIRNFCLYRRRFEPHCFVPDISSFPLPHQAVRPYIFSKSEIAQLLDLSSHLPIGRYSPLRPELYRLIILLLFTTGLRRRELLNLTVGDYDTNEGTLLVRCSKFHKSRLIPLRTDVCREIDQYIEHCRKHRIPTTAETPFLWNSFRGGRTYTAEGLRHGINHVLSLSGIHTPEGRYPRIHDFRHSFAVNALLRWYRSGVDVQTKLPFLAAYMGHVSIVSTYYYLHFVEPLTSMASDRFARSYGSLIQSHSSRKGAHP